MRKIVVLILSVYGIASSALAQGIAGDWTGQMNGGFKVRIHFERVDSGFSGKLINPSGNETVLDQITSDSTHLHFAVNKLKLSYDGVWDDQEQVWKGNLTFQQVYPPVLKRVTAEDMSPANILILIKSICTSMGELSTSFACRGRGSNLLTNPPMRGRSGASTTARDT